MTGRRIATGILVALASIAAFGSTLAVWGARTVFDTDRFTATISDLTGDPGAIDALTTYTTDQVTKLVNADSLAGDDEPAAPESSPPNIPVEHRARSRAPSRACWPANRHSSCCSPPSDRPTAT